jgi:4-diphosphocytidyl-2-C-methyl-D-erythritol kinase
MQRLSAPAKLTVSLRITGVRPDGYHLLDAEMVSVDLADTLEFGDGDGGGIEIVDEVVGGGGIGGLDAGAGNLVARALELVGRRAAVRLVKRIPLGAGLGGGSADAAAVLRWAGCDEAQVGARLGADVPFCMVGGRARVRGVGEDISPLAYVERRYLALVPPLAVDTAAAYRAWDDGARVERVAGSREVGPAGTHDGDPRADGGNDLEAAAVAVVPALAEWRRALADATGKRPRLAGSGATWFVDDDDGTLVRRLGTRMNVGRVAGTLVALRTVPAWTSHP